MADWALNDRSPRTGEMSKFSIWANRPGANLVSTRAMLPLRIPIYRLIPINGTSLIQKANYAKKIYPNVSVQV